MNQYPWDAAVAAARQEPESRELQIEAEKVMDYMADKLNFKINQDGPSARALSQQHMKYNPQDLQQSVYDSKSLQTAVCDPSAVQGLYAGQVGKSSVTAAPSTLSQLEYLKRFEALLQEMLETTKRKNSDYAEASDAFANFRLVEGVTGGRVSTAEGILVRMTDKIKRVGSLLARKAAVTDESLDDSLKDLAVYATILRIWLQFKQGA